MEFETFLDDTEEQEPKISNFKVLPKGKYLFQIVEKVDQISSKGDPMILITLQCQEDGFEMNRVWDRIVIPKKNSPSSGIKGRTKHFLHCIGEPYQGDPIKGNSDNWAWKKVYANVDVVKYKDKDQNKVTGYVLDEDLINNSVENNDSSFPF